MSAPSESASVPQFYLSPGDAWDAVYQDCAAARQSIAMEQYILENDAVGAHFLRLFADKARQGVDICLILDGIGSRSLRGTPLVRDLENAGGTVYFYNLTWKTVLKPWTWFRRNHNKVTIIDNDIVHIGSACYAEEMRHWRDTHMRIQGPIVQAVKDDFETLRECLKRGKAGYAHDCVTGGISSGLFRYATSQPYLGINPIYKELLSAIRSAKYEIVLATPYFIPPVRLQYALRRAARRGVSVQIMISNPSDVAVADCVSRSYMPKMLRRNMRIFLYNKPVLHTKYAVIDGRWAMLGSTNLDYLSLLSNREANIMTTDPDTIAALRSHFDEDLKNCTKADKAYWRSLPPWYRVLGYMGRLFKSVL